VRWQKEWGDQCVHRLQPDQVDVDIGSSKDPKCPCSKAKSRKGSRSLLLRCATPAPDVRPAGVVGSSAQRSPEVAGHSARLVPACIVDRPESVSPQETPAQQGEDNLRTMPRWRHPSTDHCEGAPTRLIPASSSAALLFTSTYVRACHFCSSPRCNVALSAELNIELARCRSWRYVHIRCIPTRVCARGRGTKLLSHLV